MAEPEPQTRNRRWWLLAFVAGAVAGLLLAPRTGRSARSWLRQKFEHAGGFARDSRTRLSRWGEFVQGKLAGWQHKLSEALVGEEKYVDDDLISDRVRSQVGRDLRTSHLERLNVDTFEGVVTLRGHVDTEDDRQAAEEVARSVRDVKGVINKIHVHPGAHVRGATKVRDRETAS